MKYDAVLEGGGVKILGLVGALAGIENRSFGPPDCIAGTSAGAIVACLRQAGYTPVDLRRIATDLDFSQFKAGAMWGTKFYHLIRDKGIYSSENFYNYISELLSDKGVRTFGDLKTSDPDPRWRYRLKVIGSDVSEGRMITFPDDAILYKIDPDRLLVADAVRISMSIPGFFRPVRFGPNESYMVDGGLLSNFPIWIFDSDTTPTWPTFGVILREPNSDQPHEISGVFSYMKAIFETMMKAHDRKAISGEDYFHRLIEVPTGDVRTTDFDLTRTQKETLYHSGFVSAKDFLDNWSWPRYIRWAKAQRGVVE